MNFTFSNCASADGITKKRSQKLNLWGWLLVGVVNRHVDVEPLNVSLEVAVMDVSDLV